MNAESEGFVPGRFQRLDHTGLGIETPVVWTISDSFTDLFTRQQPDVSSATVLRGFGFYELAQATGPVEVPHVDTLVADMRADREIILLARIPDAQEPVPVIHARFDDPHPSEWADATHDDGRLLLLVTANHISNYPMIGDLLADGWVATVSLAIYQFDTGIGSRRPIGLKSNRRAETPPRRHEVDDGESRPSSPSPLQRGRAVARQVTEDLTSPRGASAVTGAATLWPSNGHRIRVAGSLAGGQVTAHAELPVLTIAGLATYVTGDADREVEGGWRLATNPHVDQRAGEGRGSRPASQDLPEPRTAGDDAPPLSHALGGIRRVSLEGVLQMVDLGARPLQCRIDRSYLPSVLCLIDPERTPEVIAAMGKLVRVTGECEFDAESSEPRSVLVEGLEIVGEVAGVDPHLIHQHAGWQQLTAQQNVGVLHNPEDLAGVFEDDDELDEFLASLRERGPASR